MTAQPELRTVEHLKFEPDGPQQTGPIMHFKIVRVTEQQRKFRGNWVRELPAEYQEIAKVSRARLAELLADGIDWMSYTEEEA